MAQKLWRVVRACVELGPGNPIQQIHDQGAGGNCNVVRPDPGPRADALLVQKALCTRRCLHMLSVCWFAAVSCMSTTRNAAFVIVLESTSASSSSSCFE